MEDRKQPRWGQGRGERVYGWASSPHHPGKSIKCYLLDGFGKSELVPGTEFPGSSVVRTLHSYCRGHGFHP